jgi:hypothetical protein
MVRIDYNEQLLAARRSQEAHQRAIELCAKEGHQGRQILYCFESDGTGHYMCSTCDWTYNQKIPTEEFARIKRESEQRRCKQSNLAFSLD